MAIARHGTPSGAVFNLCNCMFGVGVLALPAAFARYDQRLLLKLAILSPP